MASWIKKLAEESLPCLSYDKGKVWYKKKSYIVMTLVLKSNDSFTSQKLQPF